MLAGLMIIPAVFAFSGGNPGQSAGRTISDVHHPSEGIRKYGRWVR